MMDFCAGLFIDSLRVASRCMAMALLPSVFGTDATENASTGGPSYATIDNDALYMLLSFDLLLFYC